MKNILIIRTDHLGDILLTLPMAGLLKRFIPDCHIGFLVPQYAYDLVACCQHADAIFTLESCALKNKTERNQLFKTFDICIHVSPNHMVARWMFQAGIRKRIGTSRRWFNLLYCNEWIYLKRKNSIIHEALLNLRLIKNLIPQKEYSTTDLIPYFGMTKIQSLDSRIFNQLNKDKFKLIVHTLSMGNTRHWSLDNFKSLIEKSDTTKYQIILTGTTKERELLREWIATINVPILDLTGQLSLKQLIALIQVCDGMLSNSTGPMHIAAALGKHVLGLFANYIPIHPDRWAPIGDHAEYMMTPIPCKGCSSDEDCNCMRNISNLQVMRIISSWN